MVGEGKSTKFQTIAMPQLRAATKSPADLRSLRKTTPRAPRHSSGAPRCRRCIPRRDMQQTINRFIVVYEP